MNGDPAGPRPTLQAVEPFLVARCDRPFADADTCVATRLAGGHANNALPQRASANVNCRIFPGHSPEEIRTCS